jgi:small ligand-binding sensory domain FIST
MRGPLISEIDGKPALDVLTTVTHGLEGRPLVLALLPDPAAEDEALARAPAHNGRLRPIRGVDPTRKAIMIGEPLREGSKLGFAALDPAAAKLDFDRMTRQVGQHTAGAASRFGIYLSCAGRGRTLYGAADVDTRAIRTKFPGLPVAGMLSSFEIAPTPDRPVLHYFTGVFALFTSPS